MRQETAQRKWTWAGINALVLLYAFIPVVWIISLSLKDAGTLNDGKFLPTSPTSESRADLQQRRLPEVWWSPRSASA